MWVLQKNVSTTLNSSSTNDKKSISEENGLDVRRELPCHNIPMKCGNCGLFPPAMKLVKMFKLPLTSVDSSLSYVECFYLSRMSITY